MGESRPSAGFLAALGRIRLRDLAAPEYSIGIPIGAAFALYMINMGDSAARTSVAGDYLSLAPALLGVVFAGFALVVTLMSEEYLLLLDKAPEGGVTAFLSPFILATGILVTTIGLSVAYRAIADDLAPILEHWCFGVTTTLFAVSLFDIVALARTVLMHGVLRTRHAKLIREPRDTRNRE